jgi:hypothetical protein
MHPEFKVAVTKREMDNLSVYTMELKAILLAAEWVEEVRPDRVVTCPDSCTAVMSLFDRMYCMWFFSAYIGRWGYL